MARDERNTSENVSVNRGADSRADSQADGPGRPGESWASFLLPTALIFGFVLLLNLSAEGTGEVGETSPLEHWLELVVDYLAFGAEIAAALVIGVAVVQGIFRYLKNLFTPSVDTAEATESIRLKLGQVLALGLEFTVASDILRTAVAPTREDILILGAVVLLRTLLNYFLDREIREERSKLKAQGRA